MRDTRLRFDAYSLPLAKSWQSSKGNRRTRAGWLVTATDAAGVSGYGDCCPMPEAGTETRTRAGECLCRLARRPVDEIYRELEQYRASHPSACHGVSTALLDMHARQDNLPLGRLLNKDVSPKISLNATAGALIRIKGGGLQLLQQEGFQVIKLKVGIADPVDELGRLHQLSQRLNPATLLRLDANQGWNFQQAAYFIDGIQGLPVESLEEPLQAPTLTYLEKLQSRSSIPLAMDESITGITPEALIDSCVIHRLVLKPMALGGLKPTMEIARRARDAGMGCVVTSTLESAAGIWAAVHLAAAIDPLFPGLAHGLATSQWLSRNTGAPPLVIEGKIDLSATTGSGFHPYAQQSNI